MHTPTNRRWSTRPLKVKHFCFPGWLGYASPEAKTEPIVIRKVPTRSLVAPLKPMVGRSVATPAADLADEAEHSPPAMVAQPAWLPAHPSGCEARKWTRCEEPIVLTLSPPAPECG